MPSAYETAPAANSPPRAMERMRSAWNPESCTCCASSRLAVPNISQVRTSRTSESAMAASFQSLDPLLQAGHPLSRGEPRPGDPRKLLVVPAGMWRG